MFILINFQDNILMDFTQKNCETAVFESYFDAFKYYQKRRPIDKKEIMGSIETGGKVNAISKIIVDITSHQFSDVIFL